LDPETTSFLTAMRDSIESKIETGNREGRESILRVETKLASLHREMGEQTMALQNHKEDDVRVHGQMIDEIAENRKMSTRGLKEKIQIGGIATAIPTGVVAILEWLKNGGQS